MFQPVPDKSSRLFESSSSGDDSNSSTDSDDDDDADKARFNIKQQFEGTAGRKVSANVICWYMGNMCKM